MGKPRRGPGGGTRAPRPSRPGDPGQVPTPRRPLSSIRVGATCLGCSNAGPAALYFRAKAAKQARSYRKGGAKRPRGNGLRSAPGHAGSCCPWGPPSQLQPGHPKHRPLMPGTPPRPAAPPARFVTCCAHANTETEEEQHNTRGGSREVDTTIARTSYGRARTRVALAPPGLSKYPWPRPPRALRPACGSGWPDYERGGTKVCQA
jgi:hypothetical protein